jgi:integrase
MYYIRVWHPDKREYTIMKSAGVIAETLGIDTTERLKRNITFHSFRYACNSALRGSIPDATLRLATGHADPAMTDHYDHLTDERLADIRKAQETRILRFKGA